jgi:hypothetical protein
LILALHRSGISLKLKQGTGFDTIGISDANIISEFLGKAGICDDAGRVTPLGARAFSKAPGPFGIIHAYRPYFVHHKELLQGKPTSSWVARGENVAASQEANRGTFMMANDALDRFMKDFNFKFKVFIEHAVGQGEATRQRFERAGEESIQYFGADLEDAAIDQAEGLQRRGALPINMKFIRSADIGNPELLIHGVIEAGSSTAGAVMFVGNGFHEVRSQTNEKMISIFSDYCNAGVLTIFTEESGLSNEDLLATGWNTYHAGFRYVHAISGQGLRPALDQGNGTVFSWKKCAELGGYVVLPEYTTKTRSIFPTPRGEGYNPSISVTYFCVPKDIWANLSAQRLST